MRKDSFQMVEDEGAVSVMSEDFHLLINQQTVSTGDQYMNSNHFNFGIDPDSRDSTNRNTTRMPFHVGHFADPEKRKDSKDPSMPQEAKEPVYEADEEDPEEDEADMFSHLEASPEEDYTEPEEDKKR